MILSQPQIREAVSRGEIKFEPALEDRQWGEASVDLRLGLNFTKLKPAPGLTVCLSRGIGPVADSAQRIFAAAQMFALEVAVRLI